MTTRATVIIDGEEWIELTITLPKYAVDELDSQAADKDFNSAEEVIEDKLVNY